MLIARRVFKVFSGIKPMVDDCYEVVFFPYYFYLLPGLMGENIGYMPFKGVLHPWALFLKTLCIFSKNKVTSDKLSYGSGQKYSKELKNHSFTSVETIVVKLQ